MSRMFYIFLHRAAAFLALITLACFQLLATARANDWPQWRGPDRNGISTETGWLDHWPEAGPKIAWKTNVGLGFSSFVIRGDRVYTMGHGLQTTRTSKVETSLPGFKEVDTVFCLDTETGKQVWSHSYPAELGDKYFEGGTTGSPTLDENHLYTLSRWGDLFCFEAANGQVIWSKNIQKETGMRIPDWGYAGAPLVYKNLLVLNVGEAGMGVDKNSGQIVWKSANKNAGYSTPLPWRGAPEPRVIIGSGQSYLAVNPENGKEAWRIRWLTQYGLNAGDPLLADNKMYISTGYGKGAALFDLKQNPPAEIWKSKVLRTQLSPGVLSGGFIYAMDGDTGNDGPLKCVEFQTGKERWSEPGMGTGGVMIADGKLIVLSARGELMVAPVSSESFKPTARAQVLGGKCWTAPILANGRIYCRNSRGDIVCVDLRQ